MREREREENREPVLRERNRGATRETAVDDDVEEVRCESWKQIPNCFCLELCVLVLSDRGKVKINKAII
jgi:hypothetical protein